MKIDEARERLWRLHTAGSITLDDYERAISLIENNVQLNVQDLSAKDQLQKPLVNSAAEIPPPPDTVGFPIGCFSAVILAIGLVLIVWNTPPHSSPKAEYSYLIGWATIVLSVLGFFVGGVLHYASREYQAWEKQWGPAFRLRKLEVSESFERFNHGHVITVLGGDFPAHSGRYQAGMFALETLDGGRMSPSIPATDIATIEIATEESTKRMLGALGWAVVGGVLFGPLGAAAGVLAGGRGKSITFIATFNDGRRLLATVDLPIYKQILSESMR